MRRKAININDFSVFFDLSKAKETAPVKTVRNSSSSRLITEDMFRKLLKIYTHNMETNPTMPEYDLYHKTIDKFIFEQGGRLSQADFEKGLQNYEQPESLVDPDHILDLRFQAFQALKFFSTKLSTAIITNSRQLYNTYKADHKSNAGVTANSDRREKSVRIKSISEAVANPLAFDPLIAGSAIKDNKDRIIFMDSAANYFREARVLYKIFEVWRNVPYNYHYSDAEFVINSQKLNAKSVITCDFKAMDTHKTRKSQEFSIDMLCDLSGISLKERAYIKFVLHDLHEAEILYGGYVYVPDEFWSTLSGVFPTHDSESIETFSINNYVAYTMGFEIVKTFKPLKSNQCMIVVNGDDSVLYLGRVLSDSEQEQFKELFIKVSSWTGQIVEPTKFYYSTQRYEFCKRIYPLTMLSKGFVPFFRNSADNMLKQYKAPYYSIMKAVNAIYHPTSYHDFDDCSYLLWFCAIMDNASYSKMFDVFMRYITAKSPFFKTKDGTPRLLYIKRTDVDNVKDIIFKDFSYNLRKYNLLSSYTLKWLISNKYVILVDILLD